QTGRTARQGDVAVAGDVDPGLTGRAQAGVAVAADRDHGVGHGQRFEIGVAVAGDVQGDVAGPALGVDVCGTGQGQAEGGLVIGADVQLAAARHVERLDGGGGDGDAQTFGLAPAVDAG